MTDRQVAFAALLALVVFVGGATLLAKYQMDLPVLPADGHRSEGGSREQKGTGDKLGDKPGGTPGTAADHADTKPADPKSEKSDARAIQPKMPHAVVVRRSPVLARWAVPKAEANGQEGGRATTPEDVAVDDGGRHLMVQTLRLVDVWRAGHPGPLRVRPKSIRGAHVAPDAARMYFVRDELATLSMETYDADGRRVGVWEADPTGGREFRAAGFDPLTHELTVGVGSGGRESLYAISPATGRPRLVRALADAADGRFADRIFPHADGHLLHFHTSRGADRPPGLYALAGDGNTRRTAAVLAGSPPDAVFGRPAVSADGRRAAVPAATGHVRVWDLAAGRRLFEWRLDHYQPTGCRFVNGRVVIAARSQHVAEGVSGPVVARPPLLEMYDLDTLKRVGQFRPGDYELPDAAFGFSPDGSKLALADAAQVALVDTIRAFGLEQ